MLARLETEMLMTALATRVKRIDIVGEPQRKLSNSLRQFASLPVELIAAQ
jgi:cytochrome P450